MKVAVFKFGARISFGSVTSSGGTGEALAIIRMLHEGGYDVTAYTSVNERDKKGFVPTKDIVSSQDEILQSDAIVVINGNVNFFGGKEDIHGIIGYSLINRFKGPVFYVMCDPSLQFGQIWNVVKRKEWGSKWTAEELMITRDDIIYISQPYDTGKVLESLKANHIKPGKIAHFPLEKFPCMNKQMGEPIIETTDLSYGGTMRGGKRQEKMVKFYFGHPPDICVEMFGKIALREFKKEIVNDQTPPIFSGKVSYSRMLKKMNSTVAHCVIGDPWYEEINDIPQRLYESVWARSVTFVDADMDACRRAFGTDQELSKFLYVETRDQLTDRIRQLKNDETMRRDILARQIDVINFDQRQYCNDFTNLLSSLV